MGCGTSQPAVQEPQYPDKNATPPSLKQTEEAPPLPVKQEEIPTSAHPPGEYPLTTPFQSSPVNPHLPINGSHTGDSQPPGDGRYSLDGGSLLKSVQNGGSMEPDVHEGDPLPTPSALPSVRTFELKTFKLKELQKATQQFKEDLVLGEGGFGKVYKGWLKDAMVGEAFPVAVKKLNPDSFQGANEWLAEIILLGKLRHPNLVRLFGYCHDQGEGILVYEFLAKGSLDYHLFGEAGQAPLPWDIRLKVALDSAQGLSYLHENNVIHRDFKAPNILLDEHYCAKLTDFGLAKGAESDQTHITTRIMGTMGYLDPKYMETGQLTKKSDVYAFGVMLLELLTGRRAIDQRNPDSQPLAQWSHQYLSQRKPDIFSLIDSTIIEEFKDSRPAQRAAHKLAISARHCIEEDPNLRPLMSDMVETLRPLVMAAEGVSRTSSSIDDRHR